MMEIPKPGGKGVRVLGVPSVADRIAQTVAAMALEPEVEKIFHPGSYGYRPRKSAPDAVGACRERGTLRVGRLRIVITPLELDVVEHDR
jgi:RNA-directed DNA polymerase